MRRHVSRLLLIAAALGPAGGIGAAAEPTPATTSIPVPQIAQRAEEVSSELRSLDTLLASRADVDAIRAKLPETSTRLTEQLNETARAVDESPAFWALDALAESWRAAQASLGRWVATLTRRATLLEQALDRLARLRDTWTRTRADAHASHAPAQLISRIDGVIAAITRARTQVEAERTGVLLLQDQVAQEMARAERALAAIEQARQSVADRLFVRDGLPAWSPELYDKVRTDTPVRLRSSVGVDAAQLRRFARERAGRLLFQFALFVACALLLRAAGRRARAWEAPDEHAAAVLAVLGRPLAAALVITLISSFWIYPRDPRAVQALVGILALLPAIRIVRPLVGQPVAPWLYAGAAFALADRLRTLVSVVPVLGRALFLVEMLAGTVLLVWALRRRRRRAGGAGPGTSAPRRAVELGARLLLAAVVAGLVADLLGYETLARLIGGGALRASYLTLVLYAGVRIAHGLVGFALRARPLRLLAAVRRHRDLLERRIHRVVTVIAFVGWALATLDQFALLAPAMAAGRRILTAELRRGSLHVSLGDVLAFALTVWLAFLVSSFVTFLLEEDVYPRLQLAPGLPYAASTLLRYTILLIGFLVALAALGVDLNKVTILGGAFGVGIGFGLQNVVNNFVSGLIVLFERPVRVGDAVQIGDLLGEMRRIGMRSSTVRTVEGAEVIVPNSQLVSDKVTNWTHSDRMRRIDVAVGVAYGSAPDAILDLLLRVARADPDVLPRPAPLALFLGFGDSALQFELRVWTDSFERWLEVKSALGVALYAALRDAGIDIPFPQREVRLRPASSAPEPPA
jgi:potassium efflux system protein